MKQNSHHVFDQQFTNCYTESFKNRIKTRNNIETCSKMKEDVGIVITNNYNIAINFEC